MLTWKSSDICSPLNSELSLKVHQTAAHPPFGHKKMSLSSSLPLSIRFSLVLHVCPSTCMIFDIQMIL